MPDTRVHDRVPNNSSMDFGHYNAGPNFKTTPNKMNVDGTRQSHGHNIQNQPMAVQCLNCGNMAKNFLYLESFLKTNSSKKSCSTCSSSLSYLQFLNKNIEEVFKNISAASNYGGSPQKDILPPQMQAVWTSQTTPTRRHPTVTASRPAPTRKQSTASSLMAGASRLSSSGVNRRASVGSRSAIRKKAGSDTSALNSTRNGVKNVRGVLSSTKKIRKVANSTASANSGKIKAKKRKSSMKQADKHYKKSK